MRPIIPNLWCDGNAEELAGFYVSLFEDSRIVGVDHYAPDTTGEEGSVMYVEFELLGRTYGAINGGPQFPHTEAISLEVQCDDQAEIDRLWAALADGGEPGPCGWLKDRFGVSWQVTPTALYEMLRSGDEAARNRAVQHFMAIDKVPFDIAALTAAYEGRT